MFSLESVTLLERRPDATGPVDREHDPRGWSVAANVGGQPCSTPSEGAAEVPVRPPMTTRATAASSLWCCGDIHSRPRTGASSRPRPLEPSWPCAMNA